MATKDRHSSSVIYILSLAGIVLLALLWMRRWAESRPEIRRALGSGNDQLEAGWISDTNLWLQSPNAVSDIIYGYTAEDELMAINASSGSVRWKRHMSEPEIGVRALLSTQGFVYTVTATDVHAYEAATGELAWSTYLGEGHVAIYFQVDGPILRIYYGDNIIALSPLSGKVLSRKPADDIQWIQGNMEIQLGGPTSGWTMAGIDSKTGRILWSSPDPVFLRLERFPVQAISKMLFVLTSHRGICALDLATGEYRWCRSGEYLSNMAISADNNVGYAVDRNFGLVRIDLASGEILARTQFLPTELPAEMHNFEYGYAVSLSKYHVVVSFGDSNQTFGLNLLNHQMP